uniref:Docking protein 1 n=1 Tax=Nothoprocta perdicaria TaxID=30464 RepID=A0A8C7A7P6_NOTPE
MDPPAKEGPLFVQQSHKFGQKRWKKNWFVLYPASQHGVARLEFFECKEPCAPPERLGTKRLDKKIVRLADCISVAPAAESGPRHGTAAFCLETSERSYLFAADEQQSQEWVAKLCEIAFPVSTASGPAVPPALEMAVNSIYYSRDEANVFWVTVQRTEAAERCELRGTYVLKAERDSLVLKDPQSKETLYVWPYRLLRRYGRDKVMFSFEAGRRCDSGPGNFTFETKQGNEIFRLVEASIREQKAQADGAGLLLIRQALADSLSLEMPAEGDSPPVPQDLSSVYSEPLDSVKAPRCRLDPLYSDPIDSKAGSKAKAPGAALEEAKLRVPLYSAMYEQVQADGGSPAPRPPTRKEPIYDEPEGCAPRSLSPSMCIYDEARPTDEAWRTQGHEGRDGYEYPYNPSTDDYSVPAFKAKGPKPVPAPKPQATFIPKAAERSMDPARRRVTPAPEKMVIKPSLNSSNNNNVEVLYSQVVKPQHMQKKEQSVDEISLSPVYEDLGEI